MPVFTPSPPAFVAVPKKFGASLRNLATASKNFGETLKDLREAPKYFRLTLRELRVTLK